MGTITLEQAAQWCGGKVDPKYKNVTFFGAGNDSRKIQAGELFVALQGQRDGHEFIPAAFANGASAVLCSHCDGDYPAIVVDDPHAALGDIARQERMRLGMKVVAVTGSVGKSTTKEMIASVLQTKYRVSKTPANHNNDIGMPMAILAMPEDTQVAVLEMGMNHFGEIAYLSGIGRPDIGVIVNIGTMHIEHLGSRDGILRAKLEILEGMNDGGSIIMNGDDALLWNLHRKKKPAPVYFGIANTQCAVCGEEVAQSEEGLSFTIRTAQHTFPVKLMIDGQHNVMNALCATAVAMQLQVEPENIQKGLAEFRNMQGRQQIYQAGEFTIIEDCYNAGPESMAAALNVLNHKPGRHVAVLGDMLELGVCTTAEHYKVGRIAAQKADMLFAYGPTSKKMRKGAVTGGMMQTAAFAFEDKDALVRALKQNVRAGDVILIKGSRGMHMEAVLEQFLKQED